MAVDIDSIVYYNNTMCQYAKVSHKGVRLLNEQNAFLALMRQQITGRVPELPESVDWRKVAHEAQRHGLGAMLYSGAKVADVSLPEEIEKYLFIDYQKAIFLDIQFRSLAQRVSAALTERGIPHVLLRGICLKDNYPMSALRTMSDIDILVKTEDFDRIRQVAEAMGATAEHSDGNHRNYRFPEGLTVEFHPELIHCDSPVGTGVNPGWQYAVQELPGAMELTPEGFYLNVIAHLANHFAAGGVGVRFVMDVWICRHCRTPQPDREQVERELRRIGLLEFARNIEALAEYWFGDGQASALLTELADYIITSGAHGTEERAMLNAVSLAGGGVSALTNKMFFSRKETEQRYPWVKGKPWLLPAAWTARAFRAVTRHSGLICRWTKGAMSVDKKEAQQQRERLERFGIEKGK